MVAILVFATTMSVQAKDAPAYEKGVLIQMESSSCGYAEKDGKTIAGEIFGTDGQHKNTKVVMCQEYVLQTERVTYRIRPKDDKHPVLLRVGETAQFRIHKESSAGHILGSCSTRASQSVITDWSSRSIMSATLSIVAAPPVALAAPADPIDLVITPSLVPHNCSLGVWMRALFGF